jgi:hypothetical protein
LVEFRITVDHDFELAAPEHSDAARAFGAQRYYERLARNAERVGNPENSLNLL